MSVAAVMALAGCREPSPPPSASSPSAVYTATFDPAHDRLRILLARSKSGESFDEIVARARPDIACNGTFYEGDGSPQGLLRSEGRWVFRRGKRHTAFVVTTGGRAEIVTADEVRSHPEQYPFAVTAGPLLLRHGRVVLNPEAEGFRPASRRIIATRVAIGIKADGRCLIVVDDAPITLSQFAGVCRDAGAADAVNLDGGGATALFQGGHDVVSPSLPMIDVIAINRH